MTARIEGAGPTDLDDIRQLFREYETEIGIDLCFQGFEKELAELPGEYASPHGRLLVARSDSQIVGCVALRPLKNADGICEMKRLFVRPEFRTTGMGLALVERVLTAARTAGYRAMRLDTLQSMTAARALYKRLGFREIPPYYPNPHPGVSYLELILEDALQHREPRR